MKSRTLIQFTFYKTFLKFLLIKQIVLNCFIETLSNNKQKKCFAKTNAMRSQNNLKWQKPYLFSSLYKPSILQVEHSTPSHREPKPITIWHFSWIFSFRNAKKGNERSQWFQLLLPGLTKKSVNCLKRRYRELPQNCVKNLKPIKFVMCINYFVYLFTTQRKVENQTK